MQEHKPIMNTNREQIHLLKYIDSSFKDCQAKSKT